MPKIIYAPAERNILSVSENNLRLLKELPATVSMYSNVFNDAKKSFYDGYNLPFGGMRFVYDKLNQLSKVATVDGEAYRLTHSSSGVQSALPLCMVADYLGYIVERRGGVSMNDVYNLMLQEHDLSTTDSQRNPPKGVIFLDFIAIFAMLVRGLFVFCNTNITDFSNIAEPQTTLYYSNIYKEYQ